MGAAGMQRSDRSSRRGRRSSYRPMAEINVTPFVDVMLVLLIIFMVAAPLLTAGVPINLPETAAAPLPQENEPPLEVAITAEGVVIVQEREVERENLVTLLRAVQAERNDDKIYLRADSALPYGDVAQVMGALNAAGFRNIGLVTDGGGPRLDGGAEQ